MRQMSDWLTCTGTQKDRQTLNRQSIDGNGAGAGAGKECSRANW